ncbi:hypothetical protein PUN4_840003 [Paraburkholderia unamae]|nr:hypothetical protein PUN4_840003 [Paraburkholderia unamae]
MVIRVEGDKPGRCETLAHPERAVRRGGSSTLASLAAFVRACQA